MTTKAQKLLRSIEKQEKFQDAVKAAYDRWKNNPDLPRQMPYDLAISIEVELESRGLFIGMSNPKEKAVSVMKKFKALTGLNGQPIITVLAESEAHAVEVIEQQLDREGRREYYFKWRDNGREIREEL